MIVKLPDGKVLELENGANGLAAAGAIGRGLLKAALAIKVNGELRSLQESLCDGDEISIITAKDEEALGIIRHTGTDNTLIFFYRLSVSSVRSVSGIGDDKGHKAYTVRCKQTVCLG